MSFTQIQTADSLPTGRTVINGNFASFAAKHRTNDQTVAGGSYVQDDTLFISVAANEVWHFSGALHVGGGGSYKFDGPAGCSGEWSAILSGAVMPYNIGDDSLDDGTSETIISGVFINGATPGTFAFFGKHGDSDAVMKTGSQIVFRRE